MIKTMVNDKFFLSIVLGILGTCFFYELHFIGNGDTLDLDQVFLLFIFMHIVGYVANRDAKGIKNWVFMVGFLLLCSTIHVLILISYL